MKKNLVLPTLEYINEPLIVIGILLVLYAIDKVVRSLLPKFHTRVFMQLKVIETASIILYLYLHFHFLSIFRKFDSILIVLKTLHGAFAKYSVINLFFLMIPMQKEFGVFKLPFHKLLGRLTIIWGLLHGIIIVIIKTVIEKQEASWFFDIKQTKFLFGPFLLLFLAMMGLHSIRFIRRKFYFLFYIAHMMVAPLVIVFFWLHLHEKYYLFAVPLTVSYFFVVVRWISFKRLRTISCTTGGSFVRLETEKIPKSNDGGDHVQLYCRKLGVLESHPFTFFNKKNSTVIIIKPFKRWTKKLKEKVADRLISNNDLNNTFKFRYRGSVNSVLENVKNYDHLILFGGGGGICPMISALNLIASNKHLCKQTKRIDLLLVVRGEDDMSFLVNEIQDIIDESADKDELENKVFLHRFTTSLKGRPKIKKEIASLIQKGKTYGFFFCGPFLMTLKTRKFIAEINLKNGFRINQFFLESEY